MPGEVRPGLLSRACGLGFLGGIALIGLEALAYLIGMGTSGMVFAVGMALIFLSALIGAFSERNKPKIEDVVTIGVGAAFFLWLIWKNLR